jgi:hypothetical protein
MNPRLVARIERWNCLLAAAFIGVAALWGDREQLFGVAVGGALACLNFWGVRKLVQASLRVDGPRRAALQLLLIGKMGLLIVAVFLAMKYLPLSPAALAIGLSVFVISIALESVRHALGTPDQGADKDEPHQGATKVDNG